ncbi:glycosyltransferase family 9 protein, partial [Leptolyngbya sp. FACHB-36]|uniref:glycosyltransferase family 9 protein n=1 Tax=Leptolyngbya sp. FACHB-36 TaxID=2692808 RepID=UPI0018F04E90
MMQRILFIELLGGIGDVVIALPAIHALARSHSAAELTVLTFAPGGELLESDPLIHRVVYAKQGEARQAVDHLLAHDRFDLIVSDTNYDGIAEAIQQSGTPRVVTNLWQSPPPNQRVGDRFLSILHVEKLILADSSSTPQLHLTQQERQDARSTFGSAYRPLVFLCPDAGMAIKRWAPDRFVTVGKALQQRLNATIVVPIGADAEEAAAIVDAIGGTARLWQRGSLRQFASAISHADLAIAADTGPARIAAALNVPTLTLFGPSWHERYGQAAPHMNLQGAPACGDRHIANFTDQSCWYGGTCPLPQWTTCLDDLSPETVFAAAETLLKPKESGTDRKELKRQTSNPELPSPISWQSVRNLLVLRLDNIGDVLMTSPALRALRENLPDARITLMASPAGALTAPLLPWVDEVLPWRVLWQDLGRLPFDPAREWDLVKTLHDRRFDAA